MPAGIQAVAMHRKDLYLHLRRTNWLEYIPSATPYKASNDIYIYYKGLTETVNKLQFLSISNFSAGIQAVAMHRKDLHLHLRCTNWLECIPSSTPYKAANGIYIYYKSVTETVNKLKVNAHFKTNYFIFHL